MKKRTVSQEETCCWLKSDTLVG